MPRELFKLVLYFNNQLAQVSCIVLKKNLSLYLSKHDFENKYDTNKIGMISKRLTKLQIWNTDLNYKMENKILL